MYFSQMFVLAKALVGKQSDIALKKKKAFKMAARASAKVGIIWKLHFRCLNRCQVLQTNFFRRWFQGYTAYTTIRSSNRRWK